MRGAIPSIPIPYFNDVGGVYEDYCFLGSDSGPVLVAEFKEDKEKKKNISFKMEPEYSFASC